MNEHPSARRGVPFRLRPVALALFTALSGIGIQAVPPSVPFPIDRPAALVPQTAAAVTCTTHPLFTGHLTSSSGSTTALTRTTNASVAYRVSNIDRDWSCDSLFRYSGAAWNTSGSAATFKWGNLFNSTSPNCYYLVGTTDFVKSNSTSDCPDSDPEYAYSFSLSPQGVYTNDIDHDAALDFSFAHSACDSYIGTGITKTGASLLETATNNRPASNCDPMQFDGQTTPQTVTYDSTAPTTSFTFPAGAPGTKVYRNSTSTYNATRNITEAVAGFGGTNTWKLQRQIASLTTPNSCGTFANDAASGNYTTGTTTGTVSTAQTLVNLKCYRWLANATDQNGNAMTQVTSATLVIDTSSPAAPFTAPILGTTTVINGLSFAVGWAETEVGTGIASRSLQRKIATVTSGACNSFSNDGSANPAPTNPITASLLDNRCYQWTLTVTDLAGNQTLATSGVVRVDASSPSANFSTPDEGTTTIQSSTSYSVAWSEAAGSGSITARSLQRQKVALVAGACDWSSPTNDGGPVTTPSAVNATGLTNGNCYRWVQTLTNSVPKSGASTSGVVIVDTAGPAGTVTTPESNRPTAGIVTIEGSATDSTFRDYTLEYGVGATPASWTSLGTFTAQVSGIAPDNVLGLWDTSTLGGVYTLRLSVRDWAGNAFTPVTRTVYVENSLRGTESYFERTPFDLGGDWTLDIGVANGEARLSRDLFLIPSYGPSQALSMTYSSLETTAAGRLGYGWSSNLTQYLSFDLPNNLVVWHRADGGRVPFGNIAGTWTALRGHFETMSSGASDYTITLKDQTRLVFENSGNGRLKRIENRFGKALALIWNATSATATDASTRVMNISINASPDRITGITDSAGRTWSFGYAAGAINDLTSVTDPAGKVTTLGYDGSHRLTSVSRTRTPASGAPVTITWSVGYTSAKATSVTDPVNATVTNTFTYNAGNTVVGLLKEYSPTVRNNWTYAFDALGLGRPVSITDAGAFETTKLYDADSNLLEIIRPTAAENGLATDYQSTTYLYDARGNVTDETTELNDVGTIVTTLFGYNATNDIVYRSEADGSSVQLVTKYAYDGSGHLTSVNVNCTTSGTAAPSPSGICTGAGTQDASTNLITAYTYTTKDQVEDEIDPLGRVTRHAYDAWGNQTSVTRNYVAGPPATVDRNVVANAAYDQATTAGKAGLVTAAWSPNDPTMVGTPTTYTYDALGRRLTEVLAGDPSIPALTNVTTYDEFGNLLTTSQSWTGVTRTTTYAYDKANRETNVTDPASVSTTTSFDAAGNEISSTWAGVTTTRTFDALGRTLTETVSGATTGHTYDAAGNETQTTDPEQVTTDRTFDRAGRLEQEVVTDGGEDFVTTYVIDIRDRQVSTTDPEAVVTSTTYDRPGKVMTTTVDGLVSTNAYDRSGNLLSTSNPGVDASDPVVSATVVDSLNRPTQLITNCTNTGTTPPSPGSVCLGTGTHDATTNITVTTYYDASGNVTATKDASGAASRSISNIRDLASVSIANCTDSGTTPPSDPATCAGTGTMDSKTNVKSTVTYDGVGAATTTIVAVGLAGQEAAIETAYDAGGRTKASRDPLGTVTRIFYDSFGRQMSTVVNCTNTGTTVPTSGWESCAATGTHDASWNVTTSYTYDARGNRETESSPNGRVTKFAYDDADRVIERIQNYVASPTLADENLSTYTEYDDAGRVKAVRTPTLNRTSFTVTRYFYDASGRLTSEIKNCTIAGIGTPAGQGSPPDPDWRGCDGTGIADADTNLVTTYTYDDRGNRISVSAPDPADTAAGTAIVTAYFAYDDANRLCRVLEAASAGTTLAALPVPCSTPVSGTTASNISTFYGYDEAGNLTSMVDGSGSTTAYSHDPSGRMTGLTDAQAKTLVWTYDALGRRTGQTNRTAGQTVTWTFDASGRIVSRAATAVATVTYTYDLIGNVLEADDGAAKISTTYDRLSRPTQVTVAGDSGATTTYTYSFNSPTWSDASGSYSATIDKFGREVALLDPIHGASSWVSAWRADGQQASLVAPNGNTTAWSYDDAGRPTGSGTTAAGPVTRASYAYVLNRAGQRLSENSTITGDPTNGTVNFTYDALGRLTGYSGTPVTSQAYGWDKVPNRTTKQLGGGTTVTTTYSTANRPTSDSSGVTYTNDLDGRLTGRFGQTLVWDALGRLTQVKDPITSANISTYSYDALDRLLTVSNGAGLTKFRYVGASNQIAQARDLMNAVLYNVGTSHAGTARMDFGSGGTNQRYFGVNGHGDLTWTGSSTGTVSATLRSDPWGIPGTSSGGSLPSFRFQGNWYDTSSALGWAVSRWYAPALGRFVSEDTHLGEQEHPANRHLFAYGAGEPLSRVDPGGHFWAKVRSGDTIKTMAARYWGLTSKWPTIANANRNQVYFNGIDPPHVFSGQCLWIRRMKDDQLRPYRNQCTSPNAGITGSPPWQAIDASVTLHTDWFNLTRTKLNKIFDREVGRSRDPNPFEFALYASHTVDSDVAGALVKGLGGGVKQRTFANMDLIVANSILPGADGGAVTVGHRVFIENQYLYDVPLLGHEYIHTMQEEASGWLNTAQVALFRSTQGKLAAGNPKEAMAYLWGAWLTAFRSYGEPAPWCIYHPLSGPVPNVGCY